MSSWKWILWSLMANCAFGADERAPDYQKILERKYDAPIVSLEVIPAGPTTKVLWFDWEKRWWGSLNIIETNEDGTPLFWYDIEKCPMGASLESVKSIDLSGHRYVEVIDCSHMGNGSFYLYQIHHGTAELKLEARIMTNLGAQKFEPRTGDIRYVDLNEDGIKDVVLHANVVTTDEKEETVLETATYHREFVLERDKSSYDRFKERLPQRSGPENLMH